MHCFLVQRGTSCMRHLKVRQLWLQQEVREQRVQLHQIATADNLADIFTKHCLCVCLSVSVFFCLSHAMSCHVMSCNLCPCHTSCHAWYVMPCRVMPCHVVSCMLCHVMPVSYVMSCMVCHVTHVLSPNCESTVAYPFARASSPPHPPTT